MSEKQATLWDTLSNIRSAWIIMVGVVSVIFFFSKEHHINIDQNRRIEAIEARLMRQEGEVQELASIKVDVEYICLLYTSPSPRDRTRSRMPSSA